MPLISTMLPERHGIDTFQEPSAQLQHKEAVRDEKDTDSGYEDFQDFDEESCLDSDMEGSILHRPRPKKVVKTPVLPQRNERRTSKILDNVVLELQSMDGSKSKDTDSTSRMQEEDPLEQYLSSEEDASLSDDYEDTESLMDFEGDNSADEDKPESASRPASRKSQEITATVVSFMLVGKPHIVEITISSTHTSPITPSDETKEVSLNFSTSTAITQAPSPAPSQMRPALRRPAPLNLQTPTHQRIGSSSSMSSYIPPSSKPAALSVLTSHPQRKSSRLASLVTSTKATLSSLSASSAHSFLDSDPFARTNSNTQPPLTPITHTAPVTPSTPSSISPWKKSIARSLAKARKPSLQKLNGMYNAGLSANESRNSVATMPVLERITSGPEPTTPNSAEESSAVNEREVDVSVRRAETLPLATMPRGDSLSYRDSMIIAAGPPPEPVEQPRERDSRRSFSMTLGRRKSLKGR